jgi:hypothetical protein
MYAHSGLAVKTAYPCSKEQAISTIYSERRVLVSVDEMNLGPFLFTTVTAESVSALGCSSPSLSTWQG